MHSGFTRKFVVVCAIAVYLATDAAAAQSSSAGSLAGSVRDQTGGALPGVGVELVATKEPIQSTTTGPDGRYRLDNVPPGVYSLVFRLINFGEQERRNISVTAGGALTV